MEKNESESFNYTEKQNNQEEKLKKLPIRYISTNPKILYITDDHELSDMSKIQDSIVFCQYAKDELEQKLEDYKMSDLKVPIEQKMKEWDQVFSDIELYFNKLVAKIYYTIKNKKIDSITPLVKKYYLSNNQDENDKDYNIKYPRSNTIIRNLANTINHIFHDQGRISLFNISRKNENNFCEIKTVVKIEKEVFANSNYIYAIKQLLYQHKMANNIETFRNCTDQILKDFNIEDQRNIIDLDNRINIIENMKRNIIENMNNNNEINDSDSGNDTYDSD